MKIMSDEYVDYVSTRIANELYNQLNIMTNDKEVMNIQMTKSIGIKRNKSSRIEEEVKVRFNNSEFTVSRENNVVLSFK